MKKMLLILAVGMLSLQGIAKESLNFRTCTAHYLVNVHQEGEPSFLVTSVAEGDTCAEAMAVAQRKAREYIAAVT